ncbi:MAG TPA: flagellar biosynthetic protein FliO [Acidobacteriaceae bacterium]|jgi:hypothetical protein|nr:flagellar biosynthetic protein FliO [Acidobacteriaceae bacterium]
MSTTLGISQFPFAGSLRREQPSPASSRSDNSFLSTLIDSAEKQTREEARREEMAQAAQEAARKAIRQAAPQMTQATEAAIDVPAVIRQVRPPSPMASNPLVRVWSFLNRKCALSATKQLRVAETVSLGEKRFVAVVHVAGQKFLIGGGSQGVSLLTQLDAATGQTAVALTGDAE